MDFLDSLASLDPRESPVSVSPVLLVCLASLDLKVCLDQRETLVSLEVLEVLEEADLTEVLGAKESPVCLVSLELVAHLDPLPLGLSESQAHPELLDRSDHQDILEQTEPRATLVPQDWTSLVCPETEAHLALMEPLDPLEPQDLPEDQGGTACLVCQDLKARWDQSDLLDLLEALEDLEALAALDLKVSLVSQAEMVFLELQDLKEKKETSVCLEFLD